jgi:hypothetical protein
VAVFTGCGAAVAAFAAIASDAGENPSPAAGNCVDSPRWSGYLKRLAAMSGQMRV